MAGRVGDRARSVRHAELVEDRRQMVFDGLLADPEGLRDLAIPRTGGDQGKHIQLARAERIRRQVFDRGGLMHGVDDPLEEIGATVELLQEQVLAIGGLKEKALGAQDLGYKTVIAPARNERDLGDFPESLRESIDFHFVASIGDVLELALKPRARRRR